MRIAVSGSNGFLGSWICRILSEQHKVFGLVRPTSNCFNLQGIANLEIVQFEERRFREKIEGLSIDVIILCDWQGVGNVFRNEEIQFENVHRYIQRLDVLQNIRRVIVLGSQAEVGPQLGNIIEEEFGSPTTLYGICKKTVFRAFKSELSLRNQFVWGRIFSTYGPLDSDEWLIPKTIKSLLRGQEVKLTQGNQYWNYLHAVDLAESIRYLVEAKDTCGLVNIANSTTIQIFEVTQIIGEIMKSSHLLNYGALPYRDDQVMLMNPSIERLTADGWSPSISIQDGLLHLIQWMSGKQGMKLKTRKGLHLDFDIPPYLGMK